MRKRFVLFVVVLSLVTAGSSTSDPTASDEYAALEQELAQSEAQLANVTAARDSLAIEAANATAITDVAAAEAIPDDVAALTGPGEMHSTKQRHRDRAEYTDGLTRAQQSEDRQR